MWGRRFYASVLPLALLLILIIGLYILTPRAPNTMIAARAEVGGDISEKLDEILKKIEEVRKLCKEINVTSHEVKVGIQALDSSLAQLHSEIRELKKMLESASTIALPVQLAQQLNKTKDAILGLIAAINATLDELKYDLEVMRDARDTLVRVQAVAGVFAEYAYNLSKKGEFRGAEEYAWKALNLTQGVIEAHYNKATVLKRYAEAFYTFCDAIRALLEGIAAVIEAAAKAYGGY